MKMKTKPELLAPAGDLEKAKIAIIYGADAVFVGGKQFSLRAKASNFTLEDIAELVKFAKNYRAKVFVTVNIYPHNDDLEGLNEYLLALDQCGIDAIIASSFHVIKTAKELKCRFEVHLSTQQSVYNSLSVEFFKEQFKIDRIVLAREASLEEIKKIKDKEIVDLEVFIHGGLCASFSGRCALSNNMADRDANRGGCAHSCRWYYDLYQDGKKLNSEKRFMMASKDLVAIKTIGQLIDIGVNSLKIEGRMKSRHYIATVVRVYRQLIDEYCQSDTFNEERYDYYINEINKCENRPSFTGFLTKDVTYEGQIFENESEPPSQDYIAIVVDFDENKKKAIIESKNYFDHMIDVETISPTDVNHIFNLGQLETLDGEIVTFSNRPNTLFYINVPYKLEKQSIIRKKNK